MADKSFEIEEKAKSLLLVNRLFARKSLKGLASALADDEPVVALAVGTYGNWAGLLCCTDRQLLILQKRMLGGARVERFPFEKISSVEHGALLGFGKLTINAGGHRSTIAQIATAELNPFLEALEAQRARYAHATPSSATYVEQLERLAKLHDAGALSAEEFVAAKSRLLV